MEYSKRENRASSLTYRRSSPQTRSEISSHLNLARNKLKENGVHAFFNSTDSRTLILAHNEIFLYRVTRLRRLSNFAHSSLAGNWPS